MSYALFNILLNIYLNCLIVCASQINYKCTLPEIIINKNEIIPSVDYFPDNFIPNNLTTFEENDLVSFQLHCKHNSPVKWVFDADFTKNSFTEESAPNTFRSITNFSDESTYEYRTSYYIKVPSLKIAVPLVLMCVVIGLEQDISCGRQVVKSSFNETNYVIKLLSKQEEISDLDIKALENKLQDNFTDEENCPVHLFVHFNTKYSSLYYDWSSIEGTQDIINVNSAQSLENSFRFDQLLSKDCINFTIEEPECTEDEKCILEYTRHEFRPTILTFARGNEKKRIFKGFFEVEEPKNFYSISDAIQPKRLIMMTISNETNLYIGQEILITCETSPFLFSYGTQIAWSIPQEVQPREFSSNITPVESLTPLWGTIDTKGSIKPDKKYLQKINSTISINISCIAPIWNSSGWYTLSRIVELQNSSIPNIMESKSKNREMLAYIGESHTFECIAFGIPPPKLDLVPPRENLNFSTTFNATINMSTLRIMFPKLEATYEGKYNCVATSPVGEDNQIFNLKLSSGMPNFVRIILICLGAATFVFMFVAAFLTYRLKSESQEYIRITEQAIKEFEESFKNTVKFDFTTNSEYKKFEVSLTKWKIEDIILGTGEFAIIKKGFVFHGHNKKSTVAIKAVASPKDVIEFSNSLMELTVLSYIGQHENIVNLVAVCTENIRKRSLLLGLEYCANGDLLNYLRKRRPFFYSYVRDGIINMNSVEGAQEYANVVNSSNFSTIDLCKWSYEIANGMEYLESKNVLHADLSARNVILTDTKIAKICDFGFSRLLKESGDYMKKTNACGVLPFRHMAPESLKFQRFSSKSDVWSYGVILYEIFSLGAEPWPGLAWTIEFVQELEWGLRLSRPLYATNSLYEDIMLECWRNEPELRITFTEAKQYFKRWLSIFEASQG